MLSTGWFQEKIINENLICPPPLPQLIQLSKNI